MNCKIDGCQNKAHPDLNGYCLRCDKMLANAWDEARERAAHPDLQELMDE